MSMKQVSTYQAPPAAGGGVERHRKDEDWAQGQGWIRSPGALPNPILPLRSESLTLSFLDLHW